MESYCWCRVRPAWLVLGAAQLTNISSEITVRCPMIRAGIVRFVSQFRYFDSFGRFLESKFPAWNKKLRSSPESLLFSPECNSLSGIFFHFLERVCAYGRLPPWRSRWFCQMNRRPSPAGPNRWSNLMWGRLADRLFEQMWSGSHCWSSFRSFPTELLESQRRLWRLLAPGLTKVRRVLTP